MIGGICSGFNLREGYSCHVTFFRKGFLRKSTFLPKFLDVLSEVSHFPGYFFTRRKSRYYWFISRWVVRLISVGGLCLVGEALMRHCRNMQEGSCNIHIGSNTPSIRIQGFFWRSHVWAYISEWRYDLKFWCIWNTICPLFLLCLPCKKGCLK